MRRLKVALVSASLALSTVLVAVPAMAGTSSVSWGFPAPVGLPISQGDVIQIAELSVPDPAGAECTAFVEAINGNSENPGLNVNVELNGAPLVSLQGVEDVAGKVTTGDADFISSGTDQLVVYLEATQRIRRASSEGSLTVTCTTAPDGGEGCTPGYWKQAHHFDSWLATGFDPGDSFDVAFGVSSSFDTLLDGAKAKGGGENALARHAVAALLNSLSPDVSYEFTAFEVISLVQGAYASGDFEGVKDMLEDQNEMGCPLN